jgi:tRNA pseudouridine55 synthase
MTSRFSGFILCNKISGTQSGALSRTMARTFSKGQEKKVRCGHSGTLDPLAHGLLVCAVGDATTFLNYLPNEKEYEFELTFGFQTTTADLAGEITARSEHIPSVAEIQAVLKDFVGEIVQIPPKFSALKINGKRAHQLARENLDFEIKPRTVEIKELSIISDLEDNKIRFRVNCSKGTYVRTLGEMIAEKLGTKACVSDLKRTKSDGFELKHEPWEAPDCVTLEIFGKFYPRLEISEEELGKLRHGMRLKKELVHPIYATFLNDSFYGLIGFQGGVIFPLNMIF